VVTVVRVRLVSGLTGVERDALRRVERLPEPGAVVVVEVADRLDPWVALDVIEDRSQPVPLFRRCQRAAGEADSELGEEERLSGRTSPGRGDR
jgi:hypothetical protein